MAADTTLLTGRVALITGAGRGIGRATAVRLAKAGATTILAARTQQQLQETANIIYTYGSQTLIIPIDVTDESQLHTLVEQSLSRFGQIDILINNAGGGPPRSTIVKARLPDWEQTIRTNLWATMLLSKLVLPSMLAQESGVIVNVCSQASFSGRAGEAAYAAAKFGVRGFSQALREEVREKGIKVSTIFPGFVDTTMIPPNKRLNREKMLKPADVAEAVYNIVVSPANCCPAELVLQPQYDPLKA